MVQLKKEFLKMLLLVFLKIEPFAEYGFNKSHAAAYAIIAIIAYAAA